MSTDDSPDRELDPFDTREGLPAATLEQEESTSNLSQSEAISSRSNPTENPRSSRKPRREVRWFDLEEADLSLKSIGRRFEDRLNWSELSSSNSLLGHFRSLNGDNLRGILHQCPGYLREEITLTCDLSKSAIVSHAFPDPSERCSICHQLVPYPLMVSVILRLQLSSLMGCEPQEFNLQPLHFCEAFLRASRHGIRTKPLCELITLFVLGLCWWSAISAFSLSFIYGVQECNHHWRHFCKTLSLPTWIQHASNYGIRTKSLCELITLLVLSLCWWSADSGFLRFLWELPRCTHHWLCCWISSFTWFGFLHTSTRRIRTKSLSELLMLFVLGVCWWSADTDYKFFAEINHQ